MTRPARDIASTLTPAPESACGAALMSGRQFAVRDVPAHPVFRRTKAADVLAEAQVLAVVSSPIADASGRIRGMISTHYTEERGARSANELAMLGAITRHAGALLGQGSPDSD